MQFINLKIKLAEKLLTLVQSANIKMVILLSINERDYCLEPLEINRSIYHIHCIPGIVIPVL